jgi:hypothetical protein
MARRGRKEDTADHGAIQGRRRRAGLGSECSRGSGGDPRSGRAAIGIHNDLTSLPKELARDGDVINLALCLQHAKNISIEDSYLAALKIHDEFLEEFLTIRDNLPDFGPWQNTTFDYVDHLGTMIRGLYRFHETTTRYRAGSYVDPEYKSPESNEAGRR